jgi:hypothetical protein
MAAIAGISLGVSAPAHGEAVSGKKQKARGAGPGLNWSAEPT